MPKLYWKICFTCKRLSLKGTIVKEIIFKIALQLYILVNNSDPHKHIKFVL